MQVHMISGRLTRDPEMVGQNKDVAKFTVAVDDWDSQKQEKTAQYFDCVAFKKQAETVRQYAGKGREVKVRGRMRRREYESEKYNHTIYTWELIVDELELGARPAGETHTDDESPRETREPAPSLW